MKKTLFISLLCLMAVTAVRAEPARYVTDQFEITLRSGKSTTHNILKMLPSGTRLEILDTDKKAGYSRVKTGDGVEGWVLNRYLMDTPSARERLADAEQKAARLELENNKLKGERNETEVARQTAEKAVKRLETENQKLNQELTELRRLAAEPLAIEKTNKELQTRILLIEQEQDTLRHENATLKDRTARDWFLAGAGVIVLGILIGLALPKLRSRRRGGWDSL